MNFDLAFGDFDVRLLHYIQFGITFILFMVRVGPDSFPMGLSPGTCSGQIRWLEDLGIWLLQYQESVEANMQS